MLEDGDTLTLRGKARADGFVPDRFRPVQRHGVSGESRRMTGEVTTCGDRKPIPVQARGKHLVVDIHCHLGIPAADAIVQAKYPGPPPGINDFTTPKTMEVNRAQFAAIGRTLNTLDTRLADMDRLGIDVQAISPSPGQYFYFTDADTGREAARAVNDGMAAAVAQHPDRLVGMGTVPLQDTAPRDRGDAALCAGARPARHRDQHQRQRRGLPRRRRCARSGRRRKSWAC